MKFSYAIGNPPYQETKGGTKMLKRLEFMKG